MTKIYRVVDNEGAPANFRNNRRKNAYLTEAHAKNAATHFNRITIFKNGEDTHLDGYPFTVQSAEISEWEDVA